MFSSFFLDNVELVSKWNQTETKKLRGNAGRNILFFNKITGDCMAKRMKGVRNLYIHRGEPNYATKI